MHRMIIMKRIPLIALLFFSLTIPHLGAEESSRAAYPLGAFNFDFARLGEDGASQISALKSIGYGGLVLQLTTEKQLAILEHYQAAIENDPFEVYAGYVVVYFGLDIATQNAHLDNVIRALKKSNGKLWVILRVRNQEVERAQVIDFLRSAAERTKAAGVELVIYPHWNGGKTNNISIIESAEEAIPYVEEVQNGNVFISLHLSHEIMAGNGHRLNEVAAKIKPWLRLPSINGADVDAVNEVSGWDRGIQPLTKGDYDSSQLLVALKSVGYEGPVILHTWGLQDEAADHHHTSYKRFYEILDTLEKSKTMTKDVNVETSHEFELPAAAVWNLIAGFDTLPDYHASVPESRLSKGGAVRYITISEEAGGGIVVERLANFNDEAMTFSYKIIELIDSPMPFRNYQAWVKLESTGENSCKLHWNSSFNVEGASKEEAEEIARGIYQGCYDGITRVLAAK